MAFIGRLRWAHYRGKASKRHPGQGRSGRHLLGPRALEARRFPSGLRSRVACSRTSRASVREGLDEDVQTR